jgi:hypothetical protein
VLGSTAAKLNRRKTFGEAPGLVLNWLYVHIMTRLRSYTRAFSGPETALLKAYGLALFNFLLETFC